ncbi:MAG: hypothetical protein HYY10_04080 [Candidatus Liptonbacteria bacterium]|nr:hypothetical protein [Candidatus Liptonbacteria bacterium]
MITLPLRLTILFIAVTVNVFLLIAVYRSDAKSATNRSYAALSLVMSIWLLASFLSVSPETNLLWARLTVCFATLMSMLFFVLAYTLPARTFTLRRRWSVLMGASTLGVMAVTLSPLVFEGIRMKGGSPELIVGPGIASFAILTSLFTLAAIVALVAKARHAQGVERKQLLTVLWGIVSMVGLLIGTVLVPVAAFQNDFFVAFIPLYTLFFLGMTAYAIVQYQLFNLKVIATEAVTTVLWVVLFSRIVTSESTGEMVADVLVFVLAVVFGLFLIQSVRQEVRQREELERLAHELEAANAKLSDLNRFKTQLLSLASHQIKSPLAAIKGFISLLLEGLYGPVSETVKETLGKIKISTDNLVELINSLLDLRKVEEGKMDYRFVRTDFGVLVKNVFEGLAPLTKVKKLQFEYAGPAQPLFVNADAQKLSQVVQNLIDNAIKYTPSGFVRVIVKSEGDMAVCEVSDSGLGMKPEFIPRMFDEFVRDERVKKEIKGTGLGLYIARKIVEAHGGTIGASSQGEGNGSRFFVRLKLAQ